MISRCAGGLFVGVNSYTGLARRRRLDSSGTDASQLYAYFIDAAPDAFWNSLTPEGNEVPSRSNLLDKFVTLISKVQKGFFGIFYYAGHASHSRESLVLTTVDSLSKLIWDTGVPLQRLFELVKERSKSGARFLFILDCCRSSKRHARLEDVPQNVGIIYSCQLGGLALEDNSGGVFSRVLLDALKGVGATIPNAADVRACSLDMVLKSCLKKMPYNRHPGLAEPDVFVVSPQDFDIPISRRFLEQHKAPASPAPCVFLGQVKNTAEAAAKAEEINACLVALGLYSSQEVKVRSEVIDEDLRSKSRVVIEISDVNLACSEKALVERLLTLYQDEILAARFSWEGKVDGAVMKGLFYGFSQIRATKAPNEDMGYSWTNNVGSSSVCGDAWCVSGDAGEATLTVQCYNDEGRPLSLFFLLPTFYDVFQRARSL